jgi:hypothetical protein
VVFVRVVAVVLDKVDIEVAEVVETDDVLVADVGFVAVIVVVVTCVVVVVNGAEELVLAAFDVGACEYPTTGSYTAMYLNLGKRNVNTAVVPNELIFGKPSGIGTHTLSTKTLFDSLSGTSPPRS